MAQLNDLLVLGKSHFCGEVTGQQLISSCTGPRFIADDGTSRVWFGINTSGNNWGIYNETKGAYILQDNGTSTTIHNAFYVKNNVTIGTSSSAASLIQYGTTNHKSGHIYLEGANESSSSANTTQLVFGTSSNNHIVLSSNKGALVINPSTSSTSPQIVLYLNSQSTFPGGINATADSVFGNNLTVTKDLTVSTNATVSNTATVKKLIISDTEAASHIEFKRTTSWNYIHVPGDTATIAFCANTSRTSDNCALAVGKSNIRPGKTSTYNIGSTTYTWKTGYMEQLHLFGTTSATMDSTTTNPRITFSEKDSSGESIQPVHLVYTDYDTYRHPAGLKVIGGSNATPAWFEVEGTMIVGDTLNVSDNITTNKNLFMIEPSLTKGTAPTETTYASLMVLDSTRDSAAKHRSAMLQSYVNASKTSAIRLYAYQWAADSEVSTHFYVQIDKDGNKSAGVSTGTKLYGAVWNDYAEFRKYRDKKEIPYGRIVIENGDDSLSLASARLQKGCNVCSDTFGFAIGKTEENQMPIAVAGRALVYTFEDRYSYSPGDAVCSAPNGTISKMSREEIKEYPDCIVGYVSAIPEYEFWGDTNTVVDGRIWIKVI